MLGHERGSVVLLADAGTAGNDDQIRVAAQSSQDRRWIIGHDSRLDRNSPVANHQRGEHGAIGVDDSVPSRRNAGREKLVSCNHKANARSLHNGNGSPADRGQYAEVLRSESPASSENNG